MLFCRKKRRFWNQGTKIIFHKYSMLCLDRLTNANISAFFRGQGLSGRGTACRALLRRRYPWISLKVRAATGGRPYNKAAAFDRLARTWGHAWTYSYATNGCENTWATPRGLPWLPHIIRSQRIYRPRIHLFPDGRMPSRALWDCHRTRPERRAQERTIPAENALVQSEMFPNPEKPGHGRNRTPRS